MPKLSAALVCAAAFAGQHAAVSSLPEPYATPSSSNAAKLIPQPDGAQLKLPAGFHVTKFAEGFQRPRYLILGPGARSW